MRELGGLRGRGRRRRHRSRVHKLDRCVPKLDRRRRSGTTDRLRSLGSQHLVFAGRALPKNGRRRGLWHGCSRNSWRLQRATSGHRRRLLDFGGRRGVLSRRCGNLVVHRHTLLRASRYGRQAPIRASRCGGRARFRSRACSRSSPWRRFARNRFLFGSFPHRSLHALRRGRRSLASQIVLKRFRIRGCIGARALATRTLARRPAGSVRLLDQRIH